MGVAFSSSQKRRPRPQPNAHARPVGSSTQTQLTLRYSQSVSETIPVEVPFFVEAIFGQVNTGVIQLYFGEIPTVRGTTPPEPADLRFTSSSFAWYPVALDGAKISIGLTATGTPPSVRGSITFVGRQESG